MNDDQPSNKIAPWNAGIAALLIIAGVAAYFLDKALWWVFLILAFMVVG